jgi:hypothetical protein
MAYPGSLGLGEILDRIFTTYRRAFFPLIRISAVPYGFLAPLLLLVYLSPVRGFFTALDSSTDLPPDQIAGFVMGLLGATAVIFIVMGLSQVASLLAAWELQVRGLFSIRQIYKTVFIHSLALIAAGFIFAVIFFVGYLLFIIPGIIAAIAMSFTVFALIVEGRGPVESIRRSLDLTKGFRGRIFVCFLICYAASMALVYALLIPLVVMGMVFAKPGPQPMPAWFWLMFALVEAFALIVPAPLNAIALAVVYYDARRCKEGFDIQQLLEALPLVSSAPVSEAS